jgi:hypothetical protein
LAGFVAGLALAAGLRAAFASPATSASAGTLSGSTIVITPLSARLCQIAVRRAQAVPQAVRDLILAQPGRLGDLGDASLTILRRS